MLNRSLGPKESKQKIELPRRKMNIRVVGMDNNENAEGLAAKPTRKGKRGKVLDTF
jgi:hypothetical protein